MGQGHFKYKAGEEFPWKAYAKHVGFSDEQMEEWKRTHPERAKWLPIICSSDIQDKTLIAEVQEAHSCPGGMEVGDRLYFSGSSTLDPKRSDPWCSKFLEPVISFISMSMFLQSNGIDGNDMYYDHFPCSDAGAEYGGYGNCIAKCYVVDESKGEFKGEIPKG
jgi:uncharacterized repeat protein (TIGR04076 family)